MSSLESKLDAVTIYRAGAMCRRLATLPASAERQFRLGGLPLSLEPASLRARISAGGGRVVDVRPQFDVVLAEEVDVPSEQLALEAAQSALEALQQQQARLEGELDELQSLAPKFHEPKRGDPPRQAPVEALLALGDFTDGQLAPRLARRRALARELRDAQAEVTLRQQRLQEASSARRTERARLSRVAVVTLAEAPSTALQLELEYTVPGARWAPSYTLALERGLGGGTLHMRASVAQNTGEDWSGVALSLSTALPTRAVDVPELRSLRLGRRQEAPARSGWRAPPPGLDALFEGYDAAMTRLATPPTPPRVLAERVPEERVVAQRPVPPPPAARPAAAPSVSMAVRRASMAPEPMKKARGGAPVGGGGPPLERMREREETPPELELAAVERDEAWDGEGGTGSALKAAPEGSRGTAPTAQLDAALRDYERLIMPMPDIAQGRGRLLAATEADVLVVAGVSVRVDVVMTATVRAHQAALAVERLELPAQSTPVAPVDAFDFRYDCATRLDIPSTGTWTLVPVTACAVALTAEYVCVPSVEPKVYRTLQVANRGPTALLPGPVDVTAGDEFLMTTQLPALPPGGEATQRLGLGVEEAIKVARRTTYRETTGGFLGGSAVLPHDVEIELHNRLATPALVEVQERVPWADPSEKELKVEEAQVAPPWERIEAPLDGRRVRGARRWRVTVAPGQAMKLSAQYVIRMPADRMVVGGNRRS